MSEPLDNLPKDVAALLQRTRGHSSPPPDVQGRLVARIEGAVAALSGPVLPNHPKHLPKHASPFWAAKGVVGLAGFVLGAGTGVGVTLGLQHRTPSVPPNAQVAAPEEVEATPPVPQEAAPPTRPMPAEPAPTAPAPNRLHHAASAPHAAAPEPMGHDARLAAERALLEKGRTALTRNEPAAALAAIDEHAHRFPEGELLEEREALRVEALFADHREEAGRAALVGFHARFPRSLLYPALRREFLTPRDGSSSTQQ